MGEIRVRMQAALVAGLLCSTVPAVAAPVPANERVERMEPAPKQLRGVDVKEHLGTRLPLTLGFRDQFGKPTTLAENFDGQRPVLLTLNYSNCPMLCSLMLVGLVKGLKEVEWGINQDYRQSGPDGAAGDDAAHCQSLPHAIRSPPGARRLALRDGVGKQREGVRGRHRLFLSLR